MQDINFILSNLVPKGAISNIVLVIDNGEEIAVPIESLASDAMSNKSTRYAHFNNLPTAANNTLYHILRSMMNLDRNSLIHTHIVDYVNKTSGSNLSRNINPIEDAVNYVYKNDTKIVYLGLDDKDMFKFIMISNLKGNSYYYGGAIKCVHFTINNMMGLKSLYTEFPAYQNYKLDYIKKIFFGDDVLVPQNAIDKIVEMMNEKMNDEISQTLEMLNKVDYMKTCPDINPNKVAAEIASAYKDMTVIINSINEYEVNITILINSDGNYKNYHQGKPVFYYNIPVMIHEQENKEGM